MSKNEDFFKKATGRDEISQDEIKKAAQKADVSSLMGMLSSKDKEVFNSLLKNKQARDELLGSPEAQELLRKLMGGK